MKPADCDDRAGLARFYWRVGQWLRLAQLFEARDLWCDNLVAHGEFPVLVDLEMLLQPRRPPLPGHGGAVREAHRRLRESVAHIGLLAMHTRPAPGEPLEELGGITSVRPYRLPLPGRPTWTHSAHAPRLEGAFGRASDHVAELLGGYRAMQAALEARGPALKGQSGRFAGLPVRWIFRHTWAHLRFLAALKAQPIGVARQALLASLRRPSTRRLRREGDAELVSAEVDALARGDVPYFVADTDGQAVRGCGGLLIPDLFVGSALDRVGRRLDGIATFDLAGHEAIFRTVLSTSASFEGPIIPSGQAGSVGPAEPTNVDWVAEARAIAEHVDCLAIRDAGEVAFVALVDGMLDVVDADRTASVMAVLHAARAGRVPSEQCIPLPRASEPALGLALACHRETGRWFRPDIPDPGHRVLELCGLVLACLDRAL